MAKISRDRGAAYEREIANEFKDWGYKAYRTAQHMGKTGQAPDVSGIPGLHPECKRRRKIAVYEWMDQAVNDAMAEGKGNVPVVFCRADMEESLAIVRLEDFIQMYREWEAGNVQSE